MRLKSGGKATGFVIGLLLAHVAGHHCHRANAAEPAALSVGIAETDITPDLSAGPAWLAGYGQNRRATGVHDPLMARAVVLVSGETRLAMVSVDVVGLQYPVVQKIRGMLPKFAYVMVSSTHNHEAPDVIGLWGPSPLKTGVDPRYIELITERVVAAVNQAAEAAVPAVVRYGTAQQDDLLGDSRKPRVLDGILRTLSFHDPKSDQRLGLLVQWNCHPEALGSKNTLVTADFPYATVAELKERYDCPVAYFTGAVGGLMAPPSRPYKDEQGQPLVEETFEYAESYGREVAALAATAIDQAAPIELTPFAISTRPISLPLANPMYLLARATGLLPRPGRVWTGNFEELGEVLAPGVKASATAVETEVACLRLGSLHVACIPGELYPELVYGQFQEPAEPNVDFPAAPLEKSVASLIPGDKWLLFGLANDEVGYIIPKRQWDQLPPFAYGRKTSQYGEINSCGPEVAPILMQAFENRVKELPPPQ